MVCLPLVSSGTVVFLPLISVAGVGLMSFRARRPEGLGLRDLPNSLEIFMTSIFFQDNFFLFNNYDGKNGKGKTATKYNLSWLYRLLFLIFQIVQIYFNLI